MYQFVSAETTYQQESTKSLVNSIGERNLTLSGLKFIFGSSVSQRSAYSKRKIDYYETNHYYPYQAEAGVIEMGRSNSFVHLP